MINVEELRRLKTERGYTNERIARLSGVPIGTVQKIFAGITKNPRYDTLRALEGVLTGPDVSYNQEETPALMLKDSLPAYKSALRKKPVYQKIGDFVLDRQGHYTIEDLEYLPEDGHYELIDGVIYDMAMPSFLHQILIGMIFSEFLQFKYRSGHDCWPLVSPFDVRLDKDNRTMVEPDMMVICEEEDESDKEEADKAADHSDGSGESGISVLQTRRNHYHNGAPRFVLEVLSPSSRRRDLILKLNKYMNAGVDEYWIIDPDQEQILTYDFTGDDFPEVYTFHDKVPVAITGGELIIDFGEILKRL